MVPIHPRLIEMGFVDFAKAQIVRCEGQFCPLVVPQYFNESVTGTRQNEALSNSPLMRQLNRTILADADARANGGSKSASEMRSSRRLRQRSLPMKFGAASPGET
jgi:hypothetical protein